MSKKVANYLDYVPAIPESIKWSEKNGKVTVDVVHTGLFAMIAQKVFLKPRVSHIDLDEYGSFIWQLIDSKRTVNDIAISFKEHFGEKAEPLYERLVRYMKILNDNGLIVLKNKAE